MAWDSVDNADQYKVYYDTSSGFTLAGSSNTITSSNTFTQDSLVNGTAYYFKVTAVNGLGESSASNEATATPVAPTLTPDAPANLAATTSGNQTINLTWDAVTGATSYKIYRHTSSGFLTSGNQIGTSVTNSYDDSGLTDGAPYYYIVTAVNAHGDSTEPSEVTATSISAPIFNIVTSGDAKVTLSWATVTGATSYTLYYATSANVTTGSSTVPNVTSPSEVTLSDGSTYYLAMTANNVSGRSSLSSEISYTIVGNLVAWWKLDEGSGTDANDSTTQNNHGTLTNGPTWVAGNINNAVQFDGTDDYIAISDAATFDFGTTDFSFTAWVKTTQNGTGYIFSRVNDGNTDDLWKLGTNAGNLLKYTDKVSSINVKSITEINSGNWHHVSVVRSTGNVFVYVDGDVEASGGANGDLSGTGELRIGSSQGNPNPWNGEIDDVRFYNKALSASEVASIYGGNVSAWTPADITTALWLDASDNTTITAGPSGNVSQWNDKSGNDHHMIQSNASFQPNTNSTTINSSNTISFDDHVMSTATNPFGAQIDDAHVFQVYRTGSTLVTGTNFNLIDNDAADTRYSAHAPYNSGEVYWDPGSASAPVRLTNGSWATSSEVLIASFNSSTTDSVSEIWKNGTLSVSDTSPESQAVSGGIILGAMTSAKNDRGQMYELAEMIVINGTLTTIERQKIEGYLAHKWGLASQLPVSHPYRDFAP